MPSEHTDAQSGTIRAIGSATERYRPQLLRALLTISDRRQAQLTISTDRRQAELSISSRKAFSVMDDLEPIR